jgi:D-alanyl-D-alanine dipeptidase
MRNSGFDSYDREWWHYTLKHEPYPNTYFDFPVS